MVSTVRVDTIQNKNGDFGINTVDLLDINKLNTAVNPKVNRSGDTFTGPVIMSRDPVSALEASTKGYTDTKTAAVLPSTTGHTYESLRVKSDGTVEWGESGGQRVSDVLFTSRTPNSSYILPNTVYTQAAYPALFAILGIQNVNNDATNFTNVNPATTSGLAASTYPAIACGLSNVIIAVGWVSSVGQTSNSSSAIRSTDGGVTWTPIPTLNNVFALVAVATDGNGVWVAGSYNSPGYRSTDNGLTWAAFSTGSNSIASITTNKTGIWLMTSSSSPTTFSKSVDNGVSWTNPSVGSPGNLQYVRYDSLGVALFGLYTANTNTYYKSLDNGATWTTYVSNGTTVATGIPISNGTVQIIASDWKLLVSVDSGLTWQMKLINFNISETEIYMDKNSVIYVKAYGLLYKSYDYGDTWVSNTWTLSSFKVGTFNNQIAVTSDGTWVMISNTSQTFNRSIRAYNYDSTTQFKTPAIKAPIGLKAYIKAKQGAEA